MGGGYSQQQEPSTSEEPSIVFENTFPLDILIEILSFVPAKDLLPNCALVCRDWKSLISGHGIWKRKCIREGKTIPHWTFDDIPLDYYRNIYSINPYGRNLMVNPCGENLFEGFDMVDGGDGWVIENPPNGADPVPKEVGSQSCFATSYYECSACQMIYFTWRLQIPDIVMDEIKPEIEVGEWYAARFDCGSTYELRVQLLSQQDAILDSFEFKHIEEQWTGKAWSKVTHTFKDYPSGVRKLIFDHIGQDNQFWAGQYGSKMTGAFVKFKIA